MDFGQSMMSGLVLLPLLLLSAISVQATTNYYRLPNYANPSKYNIILEPDLVNCKFNGTAVITFTVKENDKSELFINQKNLTINNVTLNSNNTENLYKVMSKDIDNEREFVTLHFDRSLVINETYTLTITYDGMLNDQKKGFYRSRYLDAKNETQYIATTHFEPTGARMAFPCWDEPEYKANFTITLIHLSKYTTVLSNMPQVQKSASTLDGDKQTTVFQESPPMSSYLVAFVVSDYAGQQNDDKTFGVFTKPNAVHQTTYALAFGQKVIQELDKYTNRKYSKMMPKMDQISIKDFSAGAMENWGLVTYRETALLYEDGVTTTRNKQSVATIIAHEFAHQWFGDLVTPKWWKYIWLNEGFANYFQYYITDQLNPSWRLMELYVVEALQGTAFITDAAKDTRPINQDVDSPAEISKLFDNIAYQKAGSVIRMMSYILTESVFRKGLQSYLDQYAYKVVESDNLINTLQKAAGKTWAGQNLTTIMTEWLDKPGYPVVTVNKTKDGNLVLSQERFLLDGVKDDSKWWIPISYVTNSTAKIDFNITEPSYWMSNDDSVLTIEAKIPNEIWVIVNPKQIGYYRVNYNEENWKLLSDYLQKNNDGKIDPVSRAQLIDDALALARERRLNYTIALTVTKFLAKEKDYIPWTTAFRHLNFFESVLYSSDKYSKFESYVRNIMEVVTNSLNYTTSANDSHVTKLLRTNVMKWACKVKKPECLTAAQAEFDSWLKNNTTLNPDLKSNILCYGLKTAKIETWNEASLKLSKTTTDQDELNVELAVLGCSNDTTILEQFLKKSLTKDLNIDFDVAVQAILTNNQLSGFKIVLDVLEENIEELKKKYNDFEDRIKSCINSLGNVVVNQDQYMRLHRFNYAVGLKDVIESTVQKSMRKLNWIELNIKDVEKWFEKNSAGTATFTSFVIILSFLVTRFY
ncbi:aminopeptidase N-like [Hylaeus anthracinus]|uniref:aminopeptidase N-like n=1 Tax=Hylaeus anthracinus TaxID=313031 RepID=UPI0023BA24B1|nr:aminopeptidase N-like [Hylaeus anthracinus]